MAFPDRIERTIEVARPPGQVWAALTTAKGLGTWFATRRARKLAELVDYLDAAWR